MPEFLLENIDYVIAVFTTLFAIAGMQFKDMRIILVSQIIANGLLGAQAILGGTASASGILFLAIIQTVISFVFTYKSKDFPVWLTLLFAIGYTTITVICYATPFDILTCIASWFFAIAVVQKNSAVCRLCSLINLLLWLSYDIAVMPSGIINHTVIIAFVIVAIIRLDREEWRGLGVVKIAAKDLYDGIRSTFRSGKA